ncbi:MAG: hypothetical protein HY755_01135 [Nitrospirae bacterium]|nr:hypothetical protein [Nitrospirota bacterium]
MNNYYAHSFEGKPKSEWQGLEEHLRNVAELARKCGGDCPRFTDGAKRSRRIGTVPGVKFGDEFGSGDWAYLAGLWHDLGANLNHSKRRRDK